MTNKNERYGYIRIFGEYDAYAEEQETRVKKSNKTKLVREHTFFNYEASALKETVDKMVEGDKLIVYTIKDLGLTAMQTVRFLDMLENRNLYIRILNVNGMTVDSSFENNRASFILIYELIKSDKANEKDRMHYMKLHRKAKRYKRKIDSEEVRLLIQDRAEGKSMSELAKKYNYNSTNSVFHILQENQEYLDVLVTAKVAEMLNENKSFLDISKALNLGGTENVNKYVRMARKEKLLNENNYRAIGGSDLITDVLMEVVRLTKTGISQKEIIETLNLKHLGILQMYIKEAKKRNLLREDIRSYKKKKK